MVNFVLRPTVGPLPQDIFDLELDFRDFRFGTFRDVFIDRRLKQFSENFMSEFYVGKLK